MKGLRFQRRIRLPLGFRINLSKSGVGWSAGIAGMRMGRDSKGQEYQSLNIPGTGITYRRYSRQDEPSLPQKLLKLLGGK